MANACGKCGGIGYGFIDEETGWRRGTKQGTSPEPCPECQGRFDDYAKSSDSKIAYVDRETQKKVARNNELAFGPFRDPELVRAGKPQGPSIMVVGGGDPSKLSNEAFDPGVVNTGDENISIEEALAQTAGEE